MAGVFLSAEWRHLAMLNYAIDARLLEARVPRGTRLDLWHGQALVSIVGFMFHKTRMLGAPIPFHTDFEELNLRFYVVREHADGPRRAVCFIKEVVKRPAITFVARTLYNENYITRPMRHRIEETGESVRAEYQYKINDRWNSIACIGRGTPEIPQPGSEAEFITEHYWGYAAQRDGSAMEYRVEHPPWRLWSPCDYSIDVDFEALYGAEFAPFLKAAGAISALLAEGSAITVSHGIRLPR